MAFSLNRTKQLLSVVSSAAGIAAWLVTSPALAAVGAGEDQVESDVGGGDRAWYESFRGSALILEDASGVDPDNPYNGVTFSLIPTYSLTKDLRLTSRFDVAKELTNDDVNDHNHETVFSDLYLQLSYRLYSNEDLGLTISPQVRGYLPTSESSRLQNFYFGGRVGGFLRWSGYGIEARWGVFYRYNWRANKTSTIENCTEQHTGGPVVVDPDDPAESLSTYGEDQCHVARAGIESSFINLWWLAYHFTDQLTLSAIYQLNNSHAFGLGDLKVSEIDGVYGAAPDDVLPATEPGERYYHTWNVELAYDFTDHVGVSFGYVNANIPQLRLNSRDMYNPFVFYRNYQNFTTVYLDLSLSY